MVTVAIVTEAMVTEAMVTEAMVTEAMVTVAIVTEAMVTEAMVTEAMVTVAIVTEAMVTEAMAFGNCTYPARQLYILTEAMVTTTMITEAMAFDHCTNPARQFYVLTEAMPGNGTYSPKASLPKPCNTHPFAKLLGPANLRTLVVWQYMCPSLYLPPEKDRKKGRKEDNGFAITTARRVEQPSRSLQHRPALSQSGERSSKSEQAADRLGPAGPS
eukprot:g16176.t1